MSIKKRDVFLNPTALDSIVSEIKTAFDKVDLSEFIDGPHIGPIIAHRPDEKSYVMLAYMVDDSLSRFESKNIGRLLYTNSNQILHLKTKTHIPEDNDFYALKEVLGGSEINAVLQSIVDKYAI